MITARMWVKNQPGLNLRNRPGLKETTVIEVLEDRIPVTAVAEVPVETKDDFVWQLVEYKKAYGWVAKQFLTNIEPVVKPVPTPTPSPVPTPQPTSTKSKITLHVTSNANKELVLDLFRSAYLAGKPVPGVLLLRLGWEKEITAKEIKQASPSTEVMLRWWYEDEPKPDWDNPDLYGVGVQAVKSYFKRFNDIDNNFADFHQIINEPNYGRGTASFWQGALAEAGGRKVNLAVLCLPNGTPALPEDTDKPFPEFWLNREVLELLRKVKREGHALMLHAYTLPQGKGRVWNSDYDVFRLKRIYALLPADLKDITLRLGEYGDIQALRNGVEFFMSNIKLTDDIFKMYPQIKWAAAWEVGHGGDIAQWGNDGLDAAIPALKEYLLKR